MVNKEIYKLFLALIGFVFLGRVFFSLAILHRWGGKKDGLEIILKGGYGPDFVRF